MSLDLPGATESDAAMKQRNEKGVTNSRMKINVLAQADSEPGEEGGQTRQREKPCEDDIACSFNVDIGERTEGQNGDHSWEGSA